MAEQAASSLLWIKLADGRTAMGVPPSEAAVEIHGRTFAVIDPVTLTPFADVPADPISRPEKPKRRRKKGR